MKIINDPVFGFIRVPRGLLLDIVAHPAFHRLSRIKQLGLACAVYPGAQHTRFQHSLGAFHLTALAVRSLQRKGHFIFDTEEEAVLAAILLHDIGHGPFSHALEHTLIGGAGHEQVSLLIMERMNEEMRGRLTLAIKLFRDDYPKRFLHQLISSQLDMDRLDYLRRDSFFTGVTEGNIGSARIIDMLDVAGDRLVVEKKGIYSVENYLVSRRLMYWQVYFHKTSVAAELVLINALRRAKELARRGDDLFAPPALRHFLYREVDSAAALAAPETMDCFLALDDSDVWTALKVWQRHPDRVLALLSRDLVDRRIFRVEVSDEAFGEAHVAQKKEEMAKALGLSLAEADYLVAQREVGRDMYSVCDDRIEILEKDGTVRDVTAVSDMLNIDTLSRRVTKHYLCTQRL